MAGAGAALNGAGGGGHWPPIITLESSQADSRKPSAPNSHNLKKWLEKDMRTSRKRKKIKGGQQNHRRLPGGNCGHNVALNGKREQVDGQPIVVFQRQRTYFFPTYKIKGQ